MSCIDALLVVKDIIVIYRKNEAILILISLKRYFSHLELKYSLTLGRHCNSRPLPLPRTVGLVCVCVVCVCGGGGQSRRYSHPKIYNDPATVSRVSVLAGGDEAVVTNAFHSNNT